MTAINYFGNNQDFYPTPARLIHKMIDYLPITEYAAILEPSAGKGDIADALKSRIEINNYHDRGNGAAKIDTVELDENLRHVLKGKGYKVVHDDFLTYDTSKRYDLIVMNPPFSRGEWHLLKAMSLLSGGGRLVAIVNAQTLKNPFSNPRRDLSRKLTECEAKIEFISGAFGDAERLTDVEIALVDVTISKTNRTSHFFENVKLESKESYRAKEAGQKMTLADFLEAKVQQYNFEVKAGARLIEEYYAMKPYISESVRKDYRNDTPIIKMEVEGCSHSPTVNELINCYVRKVRYKYWEALFEAPEFVSRCTYNLRQELYQRVREMSEFDFSLYNINQIKFELIRGMTQAVEDSILTLFDDLSNRHSWDDYSNNIHYYNGWKTNKCWKINHKVIIPMNEAFSNYSGKPEFSRYKTADRLTDIEKIFDYLDQGETGENIELIQALRAAENGGQNRNVDTKYFKMTFFKKGTCHLQFKNLDLLKKFNIYGSQRKGWLPPSYGKKSYASMAAEEKAVVDEFEGADEYQQTLQKKEYFLAEPGPKLLQVA